MKQADFAATVPWTGIIGKPKGNPAPGDPLVWDGKEVRAVKELSEARIGGLEGRLFNFRSLADENLFERLREEAITRSLRDENLSLVLEAEILARFDADNGISATVALLAVAMEDADGDILAALAIEVAARQAGDDGLEAQVDAEASARISADGSITAALDIEVSARADGDAAVEALVATEETARIAADGTITGQILSEVSAREDADDALTASIVSEETARIAADDSISAVVASEVAARLSGDLDLEAQIDTEAAARIAADGTVTASLATEVSARISGDSSLSASISVEAAARASADGSLAAEYVLEVSTSGGGAARVAGFRVTNLGGGSGYSEFAVQADKFGFYNTSGSGHVNPFFISGGIVYITQAVIESLAIGTSKLANNAVTIPVSAYTASSSSLTTTSYATFQSASIVSTGAPISITASAALAMGSGAVTIDVRILRGGTTIYEAEDLDYDFAALLSMSIQDTPGAGSVTYSFQIRRSPGSSSGTRDVKARSLLLLELKK